MLAQLDAFRTGHALKALRRRPSQALGIGAERPALKIMESDSARRAVNLDGKRGRAEQEHSGGFIELKGDGGERLIRRGDGPGAPGGEAALGREPDADDLLCE